MGRSMIYDEETGVYIHRESKCAGGPCPFHYPSDHHMRDWPKSVRLDRHGLVERHCEHGVGHPDPDSVWFFENIFQERMVGVHGCDGCCSPKEENSG